MKFPTIEEMAKKVTEKALDEYVCEGKTIRQWIEVLKDYDDKKTTLERIVERLEQQERQYNRRAKEFLTLGEKVYYEKNYAKACSYGHAIEIVKEEM